MNAILGINLGNPDLKYVQKMIRSNASVTAGNVKTVSSEVSKNIHQKE